MERMHTGARRVASMGATTVRENPTEELTAARTDNASTCSHRL